MGQSGTLRKMKSELKSPVLYTLPLGDELIPMNDLMGRGIRFRFANEIYCMGCGKKTRKSFNQGFCYNCFMNHPECEPCILRPELCRAHEGEARDLAWSKKHCLQHHFVYLSVTSGVKVGITRSSQIPTRWIDQGAHGAIKLAKTPNRHTAGLVEVELKKHMADKTDWRRMLRNEFPPDTDLKARKKDAVAKLPEELATHVLKDMKVTSIEFPVREYPKKVTSVGFDKMAEISGTLAGIKGQYLIFDDGRVLNIRKHQGYLVEFAAD